MEDKFRLIECNDGDVMDLGNSTYKVGNFRGVIGKICNDSLARKLCDDLTDENIDIDSRNLDSWFNGGIDCEILKLGYQEWKKGKFRFKVSVEFYVEEDEAQIAKNENLEISEPESPLDDLRRMINEES